MKQRLLLVGGICLLLSINSIAQQTIPSNHVLPQTVISNPTLKSQTDKIAEKEQEINAAATSSRAVMTQLNQDLTALNQEYKILLSNAISTCTDEDAKKTLTEELHFVEQQLTVKTQR